MSSAGAIRAGRAFVEIFGDKTKLEATLKSAETRLKAFSKGVTTAGTVLAAGGAAVLGPMVVAVKQFADAGDAIADMSQRTGVGATTLSRLAFAAEQSGASLDTLERGIRGMQKFLFTAGEEGQETTRVLNEIGLSLDAVAALSPEEQFKLLAQKVADVKDPSLKAALAMKLFGKSGADLIPLLNEGTAGIAKLSAEADSLGRTLTDADAQAASDFNDQLNRLWSALAAASRQIAQALLPALMDLMGSGIEWAKWLGDVIGHHRQLVVFLAKTAAAAAVLGSGLIAVGQATNGVVGVMTFFGKTLPAAVGGMQNLTQAAGKLLFIAAITAAFYKFAKSLYDAHAAVKQFNDQMERSRQLSEQMVAQNNKRVQSALDEAQALTDVTAKRAALEKLLKEQQVELEGNQSAKAGAERAIQERSSGVAGAFRSAQAALFGDALMDMEVQRRDDAQQQIEATQGNIASIQKALTELDQFRTGTGGATGKFIADLKKQLETFGLDKNEATVIELEKQGAPAEVLDTVRDLIAQLKAKEEAENSEEERKREREAREDFIKGLEDSLLTFGMSAEEAEIARMQAAGESAEMISRAEDLVGQIKQAEEAQKEKEEEQQKAEDLKARAQQTIESLKTPLGKFQDQMKDLQAQFMAGLISRDQLEQAALKSAKELQQGPEQLTKLATFELGSQESFDLIREAITGPQQDPALDLLRDQLAQLDEIKGTAKEQAKDVKRTREIAEKQPKLTGGRV